jgi:hypothetical protein
MAKQTRPRTVTVPKERNDSQSIMLTAISAFGHSTRPMFISKNKTFPSEALAEQQFNHDHGYVVRNSAKAFMTKVLFIDWLQTQFIPKNDEFRRKICYDGPIILFVDGHTGHITSRVLAYAASQKIIVIKLVTHSSHVSQPLDLCVFNVFKMLYKREAKARKMKGETLKIYRAILAFYKATIISMVRWSFVRAGFRLNPKNLLAPLTVTPVDVLARIAMPEVGLENYVFGAPPEVPLPAGRAGPRHAPIPRSTEFAVNLKAYVDKVAGICPLCGHTEIEEEEEEEKATKYIANVLVSRLF